MFGKSIPDLKGFPHIIKDWITCPVKVTKSADYSVLSENISEQQFSESVLEECVRRVSHLTFVFDYNCPNSRPDLSVIFLLT